MIVLHGLIGLGFIAGSVLSFTLGWIMRGDRRGPERHRERLSVPSARVRQVPPVRPRAAVPAPLVHEITDAAASRVGTREGS